jgi:hypothetical protein
MSRVFALTAVVLGVVAVSAAGVRLTDVGADGVPQPVLAQTPAAAAAAAARGDAPLAFAPIFGQSPVAPAARTTVPPTPAARPALTLRGTLMLGETRHAFFDAPDGEIVVREGEFLTDGQQLVTIRQGQVTVLVDGVPMHFALGPADDTVPLPSTVAAVAKARTPRVGSYHMSQTDIMALLQDPRAQPTSFRFDP